MVSSPLSLALSDVSVRRRGKRLLGPVSLTMKPQGLTIVIGPNGAGKTTFLRILHGLDRLSHGTMSWGVPEQDARARQAYVFQRPIMLRRSVADNLAYPLQLRKLPRADIAARVHDWAARIGLSDALNQSATRLSGGEQQKLALARALIIKPDLLFLDEPCANLDGRATREIEELLQSALSAGTRVIMTTHDLGQARRLASDVIFLLNGYVHDQGVSPDFFDKPATPETAAFFNGDILE